MITKLLVANRGEIARRIMRSARDMGIATVAVASDPDTRSPHASEADEVVRLPGASSADTYLRIDAIVGAALRTGADSVHPGYGFLSEHAGFARACTEAGLTFVGPPAHVIEAMGSKLAAKAVMEAAGVPVLPTVAVPAPGTATESEFLDRAAALGWPVLVKASAGGGGRGMRVVDGPRGLADALESAVREAASAFGDGTVFLEPYVARPRHIEVQIVGDTHGNVVHLFERECSIQRRHQKIIEECPSPAVDASLRAELGDAAVTAGRAIGYIGAGTVEFLLLSDGRFAFLEVNTRLQVEHPVTEAVTGLDLVRIQLMVADGDPLPPEVLEPTRRGHAIEARIYAEDPTRRWQPAAGTMHRFSIETGPGLRVDSGVEDGTVVSPHYDPMLAKVIAYGNTRHEAARTLAGALERAQLHGPTTNRDLLAAILRHPEFLAGDIDTGFLERHDPAVLGAPRAGAETERLHALTAALAGQAANRAAATVLAGLPSGWRNNRSCLQSVAFEGRCGRIDVGYGFDRRGRCEAATIDGEPLTGVAVVSADPDEVVVAVDGVSRRYGIHRLGRTVWVDGPDGHSELSEIERFPIHGASLAAGSLVAPLPGTVVRVAVSVGDVVATGDVLLAIEAMKMEHEVHAHGPGTVTEIHVAAGEQVESGRLLVLVTEAVAGEGEGEAP
jgi:acetyl/propionyl-CoA carboxylase alpha subunit